MPEKGQEAERNIVAPERKPSEDISSAPVLPSAPPEPAPTTPYVNVDPLTSSIEQILSDDMLEHYTAMPPELKLKFRQKGDETASKLRLMMDSAVIKAKDVLKLIVGWLKVIPNINKYFLEQESKIKTDRIVELHGRKYPHS